MELELSTNISVPGQHPIDVSPSHGASLAITSLPFDILSSIFEQVAKLEALRSPVSEDVQAYAIRSRQKARPEWDSFIQGGSLGWIKLTHVTRLWREHICNSMPLLWAQYVGCFHAPGAFDEMLRRAGDVVPLFLRFGPSVDYDIFALEDTSTWSIVRRSFFSRSEYDDPSFRSRIHGFSLTDLRVKYNQEQCDAALSIINSFPKLQVLELHYLRLHVARYADGNNIVVPTTSAIRAPDLREIRFTNYFLPWTSAGITHLALALDEAATVPGDILINMLNLVAPSLESLEVDGCLPARYPEGVRMPATFPTLRRLCIHGQDYFIGPFVQLFQRTSMTLTHFELVVDPAIRAWEATIGLTVQNALALVPEGRSFTAMTLTEAATSMVSEPREYVKLALCHEAIHDPPSHSEIHDVVLIVAVTNTRVVRDRYQACLDTTCDALSATFPTIWDNIHTIDLNLPLWKWADPLRRILDRLTNAHMRNFRIVDPIGRLGGPRILWPIPIPRLIANSQTSYIEVLRVVVDAKYREPRLSTSYCDLLNFNMGIAMRAFDVDNSSNPGLSRSRQPIGILRLDFATQPDLDGGSNVQPRIENLVTTLSTHHIAERIELHFL